MKLRDLDVGWRSLDDISNTEFNDKHILMDSISNTETIQDHEYF